MQEMIIRKTIKFFGSITCMAEKIGISRAHIYRYLEGKTIPDSIASRIVNKTNGEIKLKDLIPWKTKYYIELDVLPGSIVTLPIKKIIIIPENITNFPDKKNLSISHHRPICVDQNTHLIYGLEHIEAAQLRKIKSVTAWRISLKDFQNKKYEVHYLIKAFDLLERLAIRNSLETFIGNRQGRRTDLEKLVDLPPQVQGIKTRDLVADALGFGSDYVCRLLNKVLEVGSSTLIGQVRKRKISPSKAAEIAQCLYSNQNIQALKKRKKTANDVYKNRKDNLIKSIDFLSQINK